MGAIELRDGSRVEVRPIEPEDRDALAAGFERLSPEARYRRFFSGISRLRERDLEYLTNVDHRRHEAIVAFDPESGELVGVARYVKTGDEVAEPAMVVADAWQGRGLASRLLDDLSEAARKNGVRRFEAPVLADNHEAMGVLKRLGETTVKSQGREVELTITLPSEDRTSWHDVLRQVAAGSAEPARTLLDLVWPRRRGAPGDERRNVIVVGTDGSPHAVAAVKAAAELAKASSASLEVVAAYRFLPSDHEELAAVVEDAASALRERGLHVHEHVRRGDPALVLSEVADERSARLIVVGAGDERTISRRLIGGVADIVAERAPCNVLIVRPRVR